MAFFEDDLCTRMPSSRSIRSSRSIPNSCASDELPIVVLGAGMSGLQFACSLAKYSDQACSIIVVEASDRPGGKALGIWDNTTQEYDSSLQYFASSLSHSQVIKRAQEVGVDITDGPPMFSVTKATVDYYETSQPGPSPGDLKEQRAEVALHRAGYIKKPCIKEAVLFFRKHGVDFANELDFTTNVTSALSAMHATSQFLRVGGYHHLPPCVKMMKCSFDFESCRLLLPGKTEEFAAGLAKDSTDQGVKFEYGAAVVSIEVSDQGDAKSVVVKGVDGARKRIRCKAIVNTLPVRTFTSILDSQKECLDEGTHVSEEPRLKCLEVLRKASFHLYRGWIVDVERPRPDFHLVLDWSADTVDNNAIGRVVGLGNSMKSPGAVGCLQIGQVTSSGSLEPDHPDEFYLEQLRDACERAGLGAVTQVRGKAVWSMAPCLGRDNAREMEKLQGDSKIFHCSDYMFPSSMSHSMCYAARLAKRMAITLEYYEEPRAPSLCLQSCSFLRGLRAWSEFEASIKKERRILNDSLNKTNEKQANSSEEQRSR